MQLSEAGRLDLDAPVQDYLPWFQVADKAASSTITARHLLNQTSGLAGGAQINAGQYSSSQVLSPTGIEAMHQPPVEIDSSYAMGWESGNIDGVRTIEHSGALETFYARAILLPEQKIGLAVLINQNGLINLITFEQMSDNFVRLLLGSEPQGRPSLGLIYTGINTIIALDLVWKSIALLRVRRWQVWAAGKSRTRQRLDIALNLALPVLIVIGIPVVSLATLGATGTRVMVFYYIFDIVLWIGIGALLSIALGLTKIRIFWKMNHPKHFPASFRSR
jgi:hypothetical protein